MNVTIHLPDELIPVHSPLLRDSQLISFPPLIDMLKFRGFSRLIQVMIYYSQSLASEKGVILDCESKLNYELIYFTNPSSKLIVKHLVNEAKQALELE